MRNNVVLPLALLAMGATAMEQSAQTQPPRVEMDIDCAVGIQAALTQYIRDYYPDSEGKSSKNPALQNIGIVRCQLFSNAVIISLSRGLEFRDGGIDYTFDRKTMELIKRLK